MNKIIKKISTGAICLVMLAGCGKNFLDVNDNPNKFTELTPDLIISAGLNKTADHLNTTLNEVGSVWAGYWAPATDFLWYIDNKQYNVSSSFETEVWENTFDILSDFDAVEQSAIAGEFTYYQAIAKIMKVFNFQILVDGYNNVPYSEALKNLEIMRPKYDEGQEVYDDLIVKLDEAIALIKGASADDVQPGAEDIYFSGDMEKWIKFANTLKLRILLRQSEVASKASYIKTEIAKIAAEGSGFIDDESGVFAQPGYSESTDKMNPFWETYYSNSSGNVVSNYRATRPTVFIINQLESNNDPRIANLYAKVSGEYKGIELGRPTSGPEAALYKSSVTSPFLPGTGLLKSSTEESVILLPAESYFLQAEAVARGFLTGDAKALYEKGIESSFSYLGVADAANAAQEYYGQSKNKIGYDASSNKVEAIIYQKWLALNSISGWEAWTEFRRTGYPSDNPISLAAIKPIHPKRLMYPNSELGRNGEQVSKQGTIDPFTSKIFWDAK